MTNAFNPENFAESSGGFLAAGGPAVIERARTGEFDFKGKAAKAAVLTVTFRPDEPDPKYPTTVIHYGVGSKSGCIPSADGKRFEKGQIHGQSNAAFFLKSLQDAGFDMSKLQGSDGKGDITVLDGLHVNVITMIPKRPGIEENDKGFKNRVHIIDQILGPKGQASSTPVNADLDKPAQEAVLGLVKESDVARKDIAGKLFTTLSASGMEPNKVGAVAARAADEGFLKAGAEQGLWKFENGTVSRA